MKSPIEWPWSNRRRSVLLGEITKELCTNFPFVRSSSDKYKVNMQMMCRPLAMLEQCVSIASMLQQSARTDLLFLLLQNIAIESHNANNVRPPGHKFHLMVFSGLTHRCHNVVWPMTVTMWTTKNQRKKQIYLVRNFVQNELSSLVCRQCFSAASWI